MYGYRSGRASPSHAYHYGPGHPTPPMSPRQVIWGRRCLSTLGACCTRRPYRAPSIEILLARSRSYVAGARACSRATLRTSFCSHAPRRRRLSRKSNHGLPPPSRPPDDYIRAAGAESSGGVHVNAGAESDGIVRWSVNGTLESKRIRPQWFSMGNGTAANRCLLPKSAQLVRFRFDGASRVLS